MVEVHTGFDPHVHGFKFANRFHGGAVVAELVRQGRLSELTGLNLPKAIRHLTDLAGAEDFWGTFGLCGGMSWAALDRYRRGEPIPETDSVPGTGEELFSELVGRQVDSMRGRQLLERCIVWQMLPDRVPWWWFWSKDVGRLTGHKEWPALRAALENDTPASLTLIRAHGVTSPARHHQVVATGYEDSNEGEVAVHLYDPNHPGSRPVIHLDLGEDYRSPRPRQSTGEPLRGFFVWLPS
jgi:hypothetical protein